MLLLALLHEIMLVSMYINSLLLIQWINDDTKDEAQGIWRSILFLTIIFLSITCKNMFVLYARLVAVGINKCVASVLYSKVLRLSQKSLALTSTGKLITLVSGELQTIEKTFWYIPLFIVNFLIIFIFFGYIIVFFLEAGAIAFAVLFCLSLL